MAKDNTNRGGVRIGAGSKKKPLRDKILEGNPGKRNLTVLTFEGTDALIGEPMPPPHDYLLARQASSDEQTLAAEIYEDTWQWLNKRRCSHLIPALLIEKYAQTVARWVQCEEAVTKYGFLAKHPTTDKAIQSPYVSIGQSYLKQANNLWFQIYQAVRENSAADYEGQNPHDDVMERILNAQYSK